ncbi:hypothetical protein AB4254_11855 [Vibrio breoganii]
MNSKNLAILNEPAIMEQVSIGVQSSLSLAEKEDVRKTMLAVVKSVLPDADFTIDAVEGEKHLIGMSGGVDSSALAVCLLAFNPHIDFELIFCDTGNESDSALAILDQIEGMFGVKIRRLKPVDGLFEILEEQTRKTGAPFLPSVQKRWCTARLKLDEWNKYIKNELLHDKEVRVNSYVGIRWDERDRRGNLGVDRIETIFPFVEQKVEREAVCKIASEADVLCSNYYHGKSRSGCMSCFFQSQSELLALRLWNKHLFEKGASVEKLCDEDLAVFDKTPLEAIAPDHEFYSCYPSNHEVRAGKGSFTQYDLVTDDYVSTKKVGVNWDKGEKAREPKRRRKQKAVKVVEPAEEQFDMFGDAFGEFTFSAQTEPSVEEVSPDSEETKKYYVAVNNFVNTNAVTGNGVMTQRLITYSTSPSGLSRSLGGVALYTQQTAAGFYASEEHYLESTHYSIYEIEVPLSLAPKTDYEGSYTWKMGISYREMDYYSSLFNRFLNAEAMKEKVQNDPIYQEYKAAGEEEFQDYLDNLRGEFDVSTHPALFVEKYGLEPFKEHGVRITRTGDYQPETYRKLIDEYSYDDDVETVRCLMCSI